VVTSSARKSRDVADLHLRTLAKGGDAREPNPSAGSPFQHRAGDRIGLADEGEIARGWHRRGRAGVEPVAGDEHAHPIRADDAQVEPLGGIAHRPGLFGIQAVGGRPAANQVDRPTAARRKPGQQIRVVLLRQADHGQASPRRCVGQRFDPRLLRCGAGAA
jgi:hypothetical protein